MLSFMAAAAAVGMGALATGANAFAGSLTGAGSTLVAPAVENIWAPDFHAATGNTVTYGAVGSGAGISQITANTVDFGASDAPLTSSQASSCTGCIEIPWALASTGLSYNLPGVKTLRLSGPLIADIFLGRITNWDDQAIKKLNPGEKLPNLKITPVHRSDGSGDTYAFTHYLSDVSKEWATNVGYATSVNWPTGTGGDGNSGVAEVVSSTVGAIGNNSWFYIHDDHLKAVAVENKAGRFIYPYVKNVADAASAMLRAVPNFRNLNSGTADTIANALAVVDCPYTGPKATKVKKGKKTVTVMPKLTPLQREEANAYPLSTFTYVLIRPSAKDIPLLQQFIKFAISAKEQAKGPSIQFAPLPASVSAADAKVVDSL
ncbi:MAG: phosphate ABC transporter substrate-binding protein PstS [Solirubrobacteraceae bacterium]